MQPPSPTGSFTFSNLFTDLPGDAPTPARRSPASCSARCSSSRSTCSRRRSATARTSRSTSSRTTGGCRDRVTVNAGLRYTLNFPSTEENDQVGGLQPGDAAARVSRAATASRAPPGSCTSTTSARASASSAASPTRPWRAIGYGLVWIEMAGITTPFTTPVFPFLQTVSQRTLDNITPAFIARRRARASSRFR